MAKNKKTVKKPKKNTKTPAKKTNQAEESKAINKTGADNSRQKYDELLEKLTDKAARYVQEYLIDLNKQKAAERAGYSPRSAASQACVLMRNPKVIAAIDEGKRLISERAMINQDEVIKELALIGFADMKDFIQIDEGGAVYALPLDNLADGKSRIIKKVKERRIIKACQGTKDKPSEDQILESTFEFELHDKVKSLLGILDRVKPGADDPEKLEITHKMAAMPPDPKSMAEWEADYKKMVLNHKKEGGK